MARAKYSEIIVQANTKILFKIFIQQLVLFREDTFYGRNDFFEVEAMGVASLKVRILNRWGELVFESTDENATWDGTWKGKPAITGVYAIAVEAVFLDGEESKKYGSITLYR